MGDAWARATDLRFFERWNLGAKVGSLRVVGIFIDLAASVAQARGVERLMFGVVSCMLVLDAEMHTVRAEVLSNLSERANNFVLEIMGRSGLQGAEWWDKKDKCLNISGGNNGTVDTEMFARCVLGNKGAPTNPKITSRPGLQKKGTPSKPQGAGKLADTAEVDPAWADDTRKRIAKEVDEAPELLEMENNAPYADRNCVMFRPAPNRGKIDWDWVKVENRCSFPIAVIACYYDVGQERDCLPGGSGSWQTIQVDPGQIGTSIATSKRLPWQVRGIVCNMTPQKHNRMLCVLPDDYRKS